MKQTKKLFLQKKELGFSQQPRATRGGESNTNQLVQLDIFVPDQAEKIVNEKEEVRRRLVNDKISAEEYEKMH